MGGEDGDEHVTLSRGADGKVYLQPADMTTYDANDIEGTLVSVLPLLICCHAPSSYPGVQCWL